MEKRIYRKWKEIVNATGNNQLSLAHNSSRSTNKLCKTVVIDKAQNAERMKKLEKIQEKLNLLYLDAFKDYKGGLDLSVPLIPRISSNYLKNRVIVVGQETNTWYRNRKDGLKTEFLKNQHDISEICLNKRFDTFVSECVKEHYGGKFWEFNRSLYTEGIIDGNIVEDNVLSHCWVNLFAVESCKDKKDFSGRPSQKKNKKLQKEVADLQGILLFNVFKLLKPKVVLFLTGYALDEIIFNSAICTSNVKVIQADSKKILTKEQFAEFKIQEDKHPLLDVRIFRTYHPTYFMSRINTYKPLREELNANEIALSISKYYTKTFINKLKRIRC